jgi:hypothetical protein
MSTAPAAPSPSATVPIEPPSLIPPNTLPSPGQFPKVPAMTDLEQLNNFFKKTSLGKQADERRLHLQMSMLETRIRNDRDLADALAAASATHTDLKRRHLLRAYYDLYYKKLSALADSPELKTYLDGQKAAHEAILLQPKVRHETDEPKASNLNAAAAGASVAPTATPQQVKAGQRIRP